MPKTCYVIGAADLIPAAYPLPAPESLILAADGGWLHLKRLGWHAQYIIGDFDSSPQPSTEYSPNVVVLPREKDDTDTAAAIKLGRKLGATEFRLLGCSGGRIDHTLANIQLLAALARVGSAGYLMDDTTAITVLYNGMLTIPPVDGTVSIFAHSARATGVTLTNLRYPLTNATLTYTRPLGISNEMLGLPASISVSRGSLVVVFPVQAIDHVIRHMNTKK